MDFYPDIERVDNYSSGHCFYPFETGRKKTRIPRLDLLASEAILPLINFTSDCCSQILPISVYQTLLSIAVQKRDFSILTILVKNWPNSVFRLKNESPDCDGEIGFAKISHPKYPLHSFENSDFMNRQEYFNLSLCVIHSYFELIRNGGVSNIRILDLRGFPLNNIGVDYLTCQGMLSYVEKERNKILQAVDHACDLGRITVEEAMPFGDLTDLQSSFVEGTRCVIIIDCFIRLQGTEFTNLCKWLTVSRFPASPLKVVIDKLRLDDCFDIGVNLLLELTKKRPLTGIGITRIHTVEDLEQILPNLHNLADSLECLDLTCAHVNFSTEFHLSAMLADLFKIFAHLQRLDMTSCTLKRMLKRFLSALPNGLTYLNLRCAELMETDLIYLSTSFHCRTLRELILCGNDFGSSTSSLCVLLKECRKTLQFLDLEDCQLNSSQAERIFANLSKLERVEYIDLTNNVFDRRILTSLAPACLKCHDTLHYLWLPYPAHDFVSPTPDRLFSRENSDLLKEWAEDFDSLIKDLFFDSCVRVKCVNVRRENYANLQNN